MQISIYDSTGKLEAMNQNPVSVVTSDWMYVEKLQGYAFIYSLKGFLLEIIAVELHFHQILSIF